MSLADGRARGSFLSGIGRLPPRAQTIVDAEQRRADELTAAIGLSIGLFIGLLYFVSPKAFDDMVAFKPVPMFVAAFVVLSAVRLVITRRRALAQAYVYASIAADFLLLYGLIWSFHIQYEQPPTFVLKAPTLLYVFVLISVRALRFDVGSVVFAGLCAALGWAGLTVLTLATSGTPVITRDFVTYMHSNAVLIGAEIDKIVAILITTLVLALVIARGRRQLRAAALGLSATDDLSRFLDRDVAHAIVTSAEAIVPGSGTVRRGSVLVTDIRGFTRLAATLPPEETAELVIDYERRIGAVVTRHGGAIDKFLGDGILASFGCVRDSASHAADALACAFAVVAESDAWSREREAAGLEHLRIDCAVATGDIAFGAVGHEDRLEMTILGDPVNLASKLEKMTKATATRILADTQTVRDAGAQGFARLAHMTELGPLALPDGTATPPLYGAIAAPGRGS
jgi:adenylate cyclase